MRRTILITGATSGLGAALAERFAWRGARVLRVGRREGAGEDYCRADLSDPGSARRIERFLRRAGVEALDHVVHNAGTGYFGPPESHQRAELDALLEVNLHAPVVLTRTLLPFLLRARAPKLAFIGSVAGSLPSPQYAAYAATKAALQGFARSLGIELGGRVAVQLVVPGAINTGMHAKMGIKKSEMDWDRFPAVDTVAARVHAALEGGAGIKTIGAFNRVLRGAGRYLPGVLDVAAALKARGRPLRHAFPRTAPGGVAVVTGAAAGVGLALAHRFARAGFRVVGVDRDAAALEAVEADFAVQALAFTGTVADLTEDAGLDAVAAEARRIGAVDVVVHNAGISWAGRFEDCPEEAAREVLRLNLRAPIALTDALLAENLVRENGSFVFVSSISNFTGYPGAAVYAASKEGVASFARSLRTAIGGTHHVMTVYPGPPRTARAGGCGPDAVADAVFYNMEMGRHAVIPGFANLASGVLGLFVPSLMDRVMKRVLYDRITAAGLSGRARATS